MSSKPQVTITLGRSGQVVKRKDNSSEYVPTSSSGTKRSIRDRLGHNNNQPKSKRQRRDGSKKSLTDDGVDGVRVNRNDLRHKLMRKNKSRKPWSSDDGHKQKNIDLREKLSRTNQPTLRTDTRQRMPEPEATDTRQGMREPKATGLLRRIPPTRSADDLVQMDSMRNSYSNWTLGALRPGSPDRLVGTSRGLSPPRIMDNRRPVRHISSITHDASRPSTFMPTISVPLEAAKPVVRFPPPTAPGITQKISYMGEEPVTVSGLLHSLGLGKYAIIFQAEEARVFLLQESEEGGCEIVDGGTRIVGREDGGWCCLHWMLGAWEITLEDSPFTVIGIVFGEELLVSEVRVDMTALKQMGDHDLKELGIPMGPRKKILLSVAGRSKR
ncbi:hypothetical protein IFM89_029462 [Coptis chinensis]|uniref:SAM domain-containing protein n=1 Tax=Coptis chinensis TaxID=261450 RepID=A0A835LST8_9MAGN|nr:hypothetical protein IFM89_029462 [Coptis chinensis]